MRTREYRYYNNEKKYNYRFIIKIILITYLKTTILTVLHRLSFLENL